MASRKRISLALWRALKKSIVAAGLKYGRKTPDGITFHSLRHTLQTWMARWGLARHERQSGMAHTTSAMTDWYTHLSGTDTLPAARAIDLHLRGLAGSVTKRLKVAAPNLLQTPEKAKKTAWVRGLSERKSQRKSQQAERGRAKIERVS